VADPDDVENTVFESPAGRLLEDEVGDTALNRFNVNGRSLVGFYGANDGWSRALMPFRTREQTPQVSAVVGSDAELDHVFATAGQVGAGGDQKRRAAQLELLKSTPPIGGLQQ